MICFVVYDLFAAITTGLFLMAQLNNQPVDMRMILSESFYYAAIGLALYYMVDVRKRNQAGQQTESKSGDENENDT